MRTQMGALPATGAERSGWPKSQFSTWETCPSKGLCAAVTTIWAPSALRTRPLPDRVVVAAGAPWFMTVFGRDSLWASVMAMPVEPSLALGTLQKLSDRRGTVVDPMSEEEPGKILHEIRLDVSSGLSLGDKSAYYGSLDATPLFATILASVSRWGFSRKTIAALLLHADRALDWIRDYGDKYRPWTTVLVEQADRAKASK